MHQKQIHLRRKLLSATCWTYLIRVWHHRTRACALKTKSVLTRRPLLKINLTQSLLCLENLCQGSILIAQTTSADSPSYKLNWRSSTAYCNQPHHPQSYYHFTHGWDSEILIFPDTFTEESPHYPCVPLWSWEQHCLRKNPASFPRRTGPRSVWFSFRSNLNKNWQLEAINVAQKLAKPHQG